jgi:hypothetical protein
MQTIKLVGTIYFNSTTSWQPFGFIEIDPDNEMWDKGEPRYIKVAPYTIEIEMPEGFDPVKETLKGLQVQRKLILAENEQRLNVIDGKIQELLAIEHK